MSSLGIATLFEEAFLNVIYTMMCCVCEQSHCLLWGWHGEGLRKIILFPGQGTCVSRFCIRLCSSTCKTEGSTYGKEPAVAKTDG